MTWAALFERAATFDVDQPAIHDALAARRQRPADEHTGEADADE